MHTGYLYSTAASPPAFSTLRQMDEVRCIPSSVSFSCFQIPLSETSKNNITIISRQSKKAAGGAAFLEKVFLSYGV